MGWWQQRKARRMQAEFNAWAALGKGASMERSHRGMTVRVLQSMQPGPGARVLDLGCGAGWACRLIAPMVAPTGTVVGLDLSDAMIAEAGNFRPAASNARYVCAPAEDIPCGNNYFTHVLSVESFYYYPDQAAVLRELLRVTGPGGRLYILICLYRENTASHAWRKQLKVPVHLRGIAQYRELLRETGWRDGAHEEFMPDPVRGLADPHDRALLLTARR